MNIKIEKPNTASKSVAIKFKKLNDNAIVPTRAKDGDAGFDLTAIDYYYDAETDAFVYSSGIAVEIPKGYCGFLMPRSSVFKKQSFLTNSVGLIDSGYRGEVKAVFKHRTEGVIYPPYGVGERFAQLVFIKLPSIELIEVDELSDSERGEGGYGSTGN